MLLRSSLEKSPVTTSADMSVHSSYNAIADKYNSMANDYWNRRSAAFGTSDYEQLSRLHQEARANETKYRNMALQAAQAAQASAANSAINVTESTQRGILAIAKTLKKFDKLYAKPENTIASEAGTDFVNSDLVAKQQQITRVPSTVSKPALDFTERPE